MRKVSKKQAVSNRKVTQAKKEFLEDFIDRYDYLFCCGCGESIGVLNVSHLVPIGYNKSLEAEKSNLTLHCQEKCHRIWEVKSKDVVNMLDYKENLERVKKLDKDYYNLIKNKWANL